MELEDSFIIKEIKELNSKIDKDIKELIEDKNNKLENMYKELNDKYNNIVSVFNEIVDKLAWWIPIRKWRDWFRNKFTWKTIIAVFKNFLIIIFKRL